jgi:hypothetical protein
VSETGALADHSERVTAYARAFVTLVSDLRR